MPKYMNRFERRSHQRHKTEIETKIIFKNQKTPSRMIDFNEGIISVISENAVLAGSEVFLTFKIEVSYTIQGKVLWTTYIYDDGETYYQMGIQIDSIILKELKAMILPENTELAAKLKLKKS